VVSDRNVAALYLGALKKSLDRERLFLGEAIVSPGEASKSFSVLALGDSSYEHFCKTGRDFDARLSALGAERAYPRVDCDVDYDDAAAQWIDGALRALAATNAHPVPHAPRALSRGNVTALYSKKHPFLATALANLPLSGHGSERTCATSSCRSKARGSRTSPATPSACCRRTILRSSPSSCRRSTSIPRPASTSAANRRRSSSR